jgi:hypothetical protein
VVLAALALPAIHGAAGAQTEAPTAPSVELQWLAYDDEQPGLDRVRVRAPSAQLQGPLGTQGSWRAGLAEDRVSGASPRYHSAVSGASRFQDRRRAVSAGLGWHGERQAVEISASRSRERDFESRFIGLAWTLDSEDSNRSLSLQLGGSRDRISSADNPDLRSRRRGWEASAGLSLALSRQDLLQISLGHAQGRGDYADPYKRPDRRPDERRQSTLSLRWNHHLAEQPLVLRSSWRFYDDSFGVRAHTVELEPVWQLHERVSLAPLLRLHSQRAAYFYFDPVYGYLGPPYPPGWDPSATTPVSADHRLAGFGARTLGLKLEWQPQAKWRLSVAWHAYEQRSAWRWGGQGSPGLAPLRARFLLLGLGYGL